MFDDNWVLYIFIIMILFGRDGEISGTELAVLTATTLAVLISNSNCDNFFNRRSDATNDTTQTAF